MELKDAKNIFPQIKQHAIEWCIPAGLEVLLHYFGISKPTQEEMVLRYDEMFGDKGYIIQKTFVKFQSKPSIRDLMQCGFPNPHGNFDGFTTVANSLIPAECDRSFYHPNDCDAEFENYLKKSFENNDGILGVIRLPNGNCHVLPLIGYDGLSVTAYDPGTGTVETKALGEFIFNRDCIVLKKK